MTYAIWSRGRHLIRDVTLRGWLRRLLRNRIEILAYHSISNEGDDEMTLPPNRFERQLDWLREGGFRVISLEEALFKLDKRDSLKGCVVLTFDDGYADFLESALPILDKYSFKATMFVVTNRLGRASDWGGISQPKQTLSAGDLRELTRVGHTIGSHSMTHAMLTRLTSEGLESELQFSRATLEDQVGLPRAFLAYPYGCFGIRERQAALKAGYDCACGVGGWLGNDYRVDRFGLHRFVVSRRYSQKDFQLVLRPPVR